MRLPIPINSALRLILVVACASSGVHSFAANFYVSPSGNSAWSGRQPEVNPANNDGPLPSLEAARQAVRAFRAANPSEPISVQLRGGVYRLAETFVLEPEDSGTESAPIVYCAYAGERPIVSGGTVVKDWGGEMNPNLTGYEFVLKPIWTAPIDFRGDPARIPRQLFVNGQRAKRSRIPNFGFWRAPGPSNVANQKPYVLKYTEGAIQPQWAGSDAEVVSVMGWTSFRRTITSIDETNHLATLSSHGGGYLGNRFGAHEKDARFYVEGTREGFDSDGEWYFNSKLSELNYWALSTEDLAKDEAIVTQLVTLVRLNGRPNASEFVSYVSFRGINFEYSNRYDGPEGYGDGPQGAVTVGAAFEADGAQHCSIEKCTFQHLGGYAINFGVGSQHNRILHNTIADVGGGGIKLGNFGTELVKTVAKQSFSNTISDNHIHHIGEVYVGAIGILVGQSSRNVISHNLIHDTYYTGIQVGWSWGYEANQCRDNIVEYNHLYAISRGMTNDVGAIYMLGVSPGTVIRNNLIHDLDASLAKGRGIYLDEGASEIVVENNIIYRIKNSGFHLHYGRNNIIRNNIIAFCGDYGIARVRAELDRKCFSFQHNIVVMDRGRFLGWSDRREGVDFNHNLYFDVRGQSLRFAEDTWTEWQAHGQDKDSIIADPGFIDAYSGNFNLRPDSPAGKIGFKPIDMSTVGPRPLK